MTDLLTKIETPVLQTPRLTLRPLQKSDAGHISLYSSDWRVASMTSSIPFPNPESVVAQFIETSLSGKTGDLNWAVDATKSYGVHIVGVMGLRENGELGYWFGPFYWGLGFATEAGKAVVDYGFSIGKTKIFGRHFEDNPASGRVLQKLGMAHAGESEGFSVARNAKVTSIVYERRRDDG